VRSPPSSIVSGSGGTGSPGVKGVIGCVSLGVERHSVPAMLAAPANTDADLVHAFPPDPPVHDAARRRAREHAKARQLKGNGDPIRQTAQRLLAASGLRRLGRSNALALRLERHTLAIEGLPASFEGFRLLHISDPHYPESRDREFEHGIRTLADATAHDACVLTGDYRDRSFGPWQGAMAALDELRSALGEHCYAVLGNHDPLDIAAPMQAAGYDMLLNRHARIDRDGAALHIVGIDDPSYYRCDELDAALPDSGATVLLAHSPNRYREAAAADVDAYLCGHTHGGQVCLPGGMACVECGRADRRRGWLPDSRAMGFPCARVLLVERTRHRATALPDPRHHRHPRHGGAVAVRRATGASQRNRVG